jgi:hypothetical protein
MYDPALARCELFTAPTQPPGWSWQPGLGFACQDAPGRPADPPTASDAPTGLARPDPTPSSAGPADQEDPGQAVRLVSTRLAHVLAETLDGKRRVAQLEAWFAPACLELVLERALALRGTPVRLASVRVQPTSARAAEVTARLATPRLNYAAAWRVTRHGEAWVCTDLVLA